MHNNEYLLKICAIGSANAEKTPLIRRFAENKFDTNYLPTLGVDITTKKIEINDNQVKLIIVDTAGQEFFGKLRPSYYRGATAAIIFFNRNNRESFLSISKILSEFQTYIQPKVPLALVGITSTSNVVSTGEAEYVAKSLNLQYFECRSKTCPRLARVFIILAGQVINVPSSSQEEMSDSLISLVSIYLCYLNVVFLQFLAHLLDFIRGKFSHDKNRD